MAETSTTTNTAVATAIDLLPDEPEHQDDPRWAYELTKQQAYAAWPCGDCGTRRDEHADQPVKSAFPNLDITGHDFVETLNPEPSA